MISLLLAWSRLGRMSLRLESFDVASLVGDIVNSLKHQMLERNVAVAVRDLPNITADRGAFEQILGNLLDNAIKYLRKDVPGHIEVTCELMDRDYLFRVKDNGCGIAPQHMEKVFAPFKRFAQNHVTGDGMGLAYTRSLVNRHLGQIWCESIQNEGSTFFFTIPKSIKRELDHASGNASRDPAD